MSQIYYFAYGANMDADVMKRRGVNFSRRFSGFLPDWRRVFVEFPQHQKGIGYGNIEPSMGDRVEGVVYEADISVENLDKYEGVPIYYTREKKKIVCEEGEVECFVYVGTPASLGDYAPPTQEYIDHLLGAGDLISDECRDALKSIKTTDEDALHEI